MDEKTRIDRHGRFADKKVGDISYEEMAASRAGSRARRRREERRESGNQTIRERVNFQRKNALKDRADLEASDPNVVRGRNSTYRLKLNNLLKALETADAETERANPAQKEAADLSDMTMQKLSEIRTKKKDRKE